jgi:hypothetical protein
VLVEISLDAFCSWVCSHECDVVGHPGSWFDSPLARWLSELSGHIYGMDGRLYGRASCDDERWQVLPYWAEVFSVWVESCPAQPMTGYEALLVLARVELALRPFGATRCVSAAGHANVVV